MTNINTLTIENFLSDSEIQEIEEMYKNGEASLKIDDVPEIPPEMNLDRTANYWHFDIYNNLRLNEILLLKLKKIFHKDLYVDDCHILESFYPYVVHTDAVAFDESINGHQDGTVQANTGYTSGWTFIIPLDTYNSHTIIFDQEVPLIKVPCTWIQKENPPILDSISDDIYEKYLKRAISREEARYLSIEEIFPWKKGSLSATSRGKFHCSDDFIGNGLKSKRAIVMWTTIPTENFNG